MHDHTRVRARGRLGDNLEKNCGKRVEQGRVDELECGQSGGTEQGRLGSRAQKKIFLGANLVEEGGKNNNCRQ